MITDTAAAWIRAHAWTKAMRKTHRDTPAVYTHCACQYGPSGYCGAGQHRQCDHRDGQRPRKPTPETWVCTRADLALTQVWLADRRCVWHCPCDCHFGGLAGTQLDLFAIGRSP